MLDGFDLGLGGIMPLLAKDDSDRRIIYNAMGPVWDGNEVWLIAAGGVTFAAFPAAYAVMFSSLYSALMLILFALIIRAASFEFRGKVDSPAWRTLWDSCLVIGSLSPAVLFGIAFANIFRGIPIDANGIYHGSLLTLLNPYGLIGGLLFLLLFLVHGSLWLAIKSEGRLYERAGLIAAKLWPALVVVVVVFLVATGFATKLYNNYMSEPILFILPLITVASLVKVRFYILKAAWWMAWYTSSLTIVGITFFGLIGLYPNLLPSSLNPAYSLTIYNSASSHLTLKIMLGVVLIFMPLIILYQGWVYRLFKNKVKKEDVGYEDVY